MPGQTAQAFKKKDKKEIKKHFLSFELMLYQLIHLISWVIWMIVDSHLIISVAMKFTDYDRATTTIETLEKLAHQCRVQNTKS